MNIKIQNHCENVSKNVSEMEAKFKYAFKFSFINENSFCFISDRVWYERRLCSAYQGVQSITNPKSSLA